MSAALLLLLAAAEPAGARVIVDVAGLPADLTPPPPNAEAAALFAARCALCHGKTGAADGPSAAALKPKPRRFSDAFWQASVTDEHMKSVIVKGGAAHKLSSLMPPAPDLNDKPLLDALVAHIRALRAPATVRVSVAGKSATADAAGGKAVVTVVGVPDGTHALSVERAPPLSPVCAGPITVAGADVGFSCAVSRP